MRSWIRGGVLAVVLLAAVALTAQSTSPVLASSHAIAAVTSQDMDQACPSYVVQPGDWLSRIAARFSTTWQNLANLNHLANPNLIFPRQVLCVGGTVSTPSVSTPQTITSSGSWYFAAGEPCRSASMWVANISQWTVPPGCYAGIYHPNPANYAPRSGYGWCSWWPKVLHPSGGDAVLHRTQIKTPHVGDIVVFRAGDQGASPVGHYANIVGINPNGWMLISEMNMYWRGGGWEKVSYRYIRNDVGTFFITV